MSESILPGTWRKSTRCDSSGCVEVAKLAAGMFGIRDSKRPDDPALQFTADEWEKFVGGVRAGEFDFGEDS